MSTYFNQDYPLLYEGCIAPDALQNFITALADKANVYVTKRTQHAFQVMAMTNKDVEKDVLQAFTTYGYFVRIHFNLQTNRP